MVRLLGALLSAFLGVMALCVSCETVASPALGILTPPEGSVVEDDQADVTGRFSLTGGTEVAVTVNGVHAVVIGKVFVLGAVPLRPGSNVITVTATGEDGATTRSITVWSAGRSALKLNMDAAEGPAPFTVALTLEDQLARDISRIDLDFGDGTPPTSIPQGTTIEHVYTRPGRYFIWVHVTLPDGRMHSLSRAVAVTDPEATDARLKTIWNRFAQALASGDKTQAMLLLTQPAKAKYEAVFDTLLPQMPSVVQSLSPIQKIALSPQLGEYAVVRTVDGANRLFFVHFLLDFDGLWRLEDM